MPHTVCPHATRKRRPKLALSLRTHTRTSVLDLMEMPDLHQLHLLGLALARGSCISLSARSRWSRIERGLRPPLLALAGLDEAPQGLQEGGVHRRSTRGCCGGRAARRVHLPSAAPPVAQRASAAPRPARRPGHLGGKQLARSRRRQAGLRSTVRNLCANAQLESF